MEQHDGYNSAKGADDFFRSPPGKRRPSPTHMTDHPLPPYTLEVRLLSHEGTETLPRFERHVPYFQFGREARFAVIGAKVVVRDTHQTMMGTEHLLVGILRRPRQVVSALFETLGVDLTAVLQTLEAALPIGEAERPPDPLSVTPALLSALQMALEESTARQYQVATEHLLLAILREGSGLANHVLAGYEITYERTRSLLP